MEGRGGRCRLLWLCSFSLSPTVAPSPGTYLAGKNTHNRRQTEKMLSHADKKKKEKKKHTSTHGRSGFVVLRTACTYVNHVTADTQGALVPVSGASGCLRDLWNVVCVFTRRGFISRGSLANSDTHEHHCTLLTPMHRTRKDLLCF